MAGNDNPKSLMTTNDNDNDDNVAYKKAWQKFVCLNFIL